MKKHPILLHPVRLWRRPAAGIFAVILVAALGTILGLKARVPSSHLAFPGHNTVTGTFVRNGVYPTTSPGDCPEAQETGMGSWGGSDLNTGTLATTVFHAPVDLNFCVAGYPGTEGIRIYLENESRSQTLELKIRWVPAEAWRHVAWQLPPAWRGKPVRLVAADHAAAPSGWIGVTAPREGDGVTVAASLGRAVTILASLTGQAVLMLLPGLCLALLVHRYRILGPLRFAAVTLLTAASIGYAAFWVYFASVTAGKVLSIITLGGSAVTVAAMLIGCWPGRPLFRELLIAVGAALLAASFYSSLGYLYRTIEGPDRQAQTRILESLPPDNVLPYLFAERVYLQEPLRSNLIDIWKTSDRPPLQTGLALEQYPLWLLFPRGVHYQLLAVFLQSLWIAAMWIFLRFARVSARSIMIVLGFCVFSGFFFLHSFYVWPKLLSAALLLLGLAFTPMSRPAGYRWSQLDVTLASLGTVLAMLSHTGVVFTVFGVAAVLVATRQIPSWKLLAQALLVITLMWLPWMLYQKVYNPPGDMLLKMHLAGSIDPNRSFGTLIADAYGHIPAAALFRSKYENFRVLFYENHWKDLVAPVGLRQWLDAYQTGNFFCLFQALAMANLGLLAMIVPGWRNRPPEARVAVRAVTAALVSTVAWCLVMYQPGSAVIHQGSLLNVMLLFLGSGICLAVRWPRLVRPALAIHAFALFPIYVAARRIINESPAFVIDGTVDLAFAGFAILLAGAMILCGFWID